MNLIKLTKEYAIKYLSIGNFQTISPEYIIMSCFLSVLGGILLFILTIIPVTELLKSTSFKVIKYKSVRFFVTTIICLITSIIGLISIYNLFMYLGVYIPIIIKFLDHLFIRSFTDISEMSITSSSSSSSSGPSTPPAQGSTN